MKQTYRIGLLLFLLACSNQDGAEEKVILINIRGTSYAALNEYLEKTELSFLKQALIESRIRELIPVENAVTAVNMASFETGTTPDQHGIVGHLFADPDAKIKAKSGFNTLYETETIWEQSSNASLNVLTIGSLVMHGKKRVHANVDMIAQGEQMGSAKFWDLAIGKTQEAAGYQYIRELKSEKNQKLQLNDSTAFYAFLGNSIFDENEEKLEIILDSDQIISNGILTKFAIDEWGVWVINKKPFQISTRLTVLNWDSASGRLRLFARAPFMNKGKPADFVEHIEQKIGPSTGWLSLPEYFAGKIDDQTLQEEIDQEVDYVMSISTDAVESEAYDLISIDYPLMDRYGHIYTVTDKRQAAIDKKELYEGYRFKAFQRMDRELHAIAELAEKYNYRLIIASGHGFSAIYTEINVNRLLTDAGFITDGDKWQVKAYPGKVSAHIYLNEKTVNEADRQKIAEKIESLFSTLTDPLDGESLVDQILLKSQLKSVQLNHENSGDFWVQLNPGYVFQAQIYSERPVFDAANFRGDHGYSSELTESKGVIIFDEELEKESYQVTEIAKRVEDLLGIEAVFRSN